MGSVSLFLSGLLLLACSAHAQTRTESTLADDNLFTGKNTFKQLNSIRFADQFPSVQAAIDSLGPAGGWVFVPPGTYVSPATLVVRNGIHLKCAGYESTNLRYTGSSAAVAFGESSKGTIGASLEGCLVEVTNAAARGIVFSGSSANPDFPSTRNIVRANRITGTRKAAAIEFEQSAWGNRLEHNTIDNCHTGIDFIGRRYATNNNVILGNYISCVGPGSIGVYAHQISGPASINIIENDIEDSEIGIKLSGPEPRGTEIVGNYLENNVTNIVISGASTGVIKSNRTFGHGAKPGFNTAVRSIELIEAQAWELGPNSHNGSYSESILSLDRKSFGNILIGYNQDREHTFARGALNTLLGTLPAGVNVIGGKLRSTRDGDLSNQYVELDGSGPHALVNASPAHGDLILALDGAPAVTTNPTRTSVSGSLSVGGGPAIANSAALALIKTGRGSPEGVVAAKTGTLYLRTDGSSHSTLYVKESGDGSAGWVAK